jgi:hypothetical protein
LFRATPNLYFILYLASVRAYLSHLQIARYCDKQFTAHTLCHVLSQEKDS